MIIITFILMLTWVNPGQLDSWPGFSPKSTIELGCKTMIITFFILTCIQRIILKLEVFYKDILEIKKILSSKTCTFYNSCFGSTKIHFKFVLETYLFLYICLCHFNQIYFCLYCLCLFFLRPVTKHYHKVAKHTTQIWIFANFECFLGINDDLKNKLYSFFLFVYYSNISL